MSLVELMALVETAPAVTTAVVTERSWWETVVAFFQDGGWFMYITLTIAVVGAIMSIERFIVITRTRVANQQMWKQIFPLLTQGKFKQAHDMAKASNSAIARILLYGMARMQYAKSHEEIEQAMDEGLMEAIPLLEKRTPYIATFANVATLLGLVGTIFGLIRAFAAVANADPAQKANMLSSSISIALNNTGFGLMVAIPLLLIFTYLQARTTEVVDSLEMATVKFLNVLRQAQQSAGAKPTSTDTTK
ncbi:MAG TPA: MotA/TolQ/ExbB proton channel family protein [Dongiaceae bacterium]|nr:MotA/TolQ/ExbB proton channel family protein [Dongiaceae bacterium]